MSGENTTSSPTRRPWYRAMTARSPDEAHRTATPLELFFDLCFVVAVAQAADLLHHDVSQGHGGHGVVAYLMVFFAIWWAWMNFTWFASAYDTDDDVYRLTTLVQIAGALVLAAGVPSAFETANFAVVTYGYVLMRLALVTQWLRAARADPRRRRTALRYAIGVAVVQLAWLLRLALTDDAAIAALAVLVIADMLVPIWAERTTPTTWHPQHVAERYGLFTLIVLGESVLAVTFAVQGAVRTEYVSVLSVAAAGIAIVFSMWWLYFDRPAHQLLTSLRRALFWGYGHYLIFASVAAVGAGLAVAVDQETDKTHHPSAVAAGYATAVPVALFLLSVWVLQISPHRRGAITFAFPITAALVALTPFGPAPVAVIALLMAALVAVTVITGGGRRAGGVPG